MKCLKSAILASLVVPFLFFSGLSADEYDPYYPDSDNLLVEVKRFPRRSITGYAETNNPVCYAIKNQKRLELLVENAEILNKKETRIIVKKLLVEPYAFGMNNDGKPVYYGKVTDEKLEKDISIKFGYDKFNDNDISASSKKDKITSGWFSADSKSWFGSDKNKDIDLMSLRGVKVIEDSHFDAPKEYAGYNPTNVQILCQLPITKEDKQ